MAINTDLNTRFNLTIPKTLKKQLEEIAENENRTLTNCIINILKEKVKTANSGCLFYLRIFNFTI